MVTRVSRSTSLDDTSNVRSIVTGVDPHGRSASAVVWAVEEAELDGALLTLVSARTDDRPSQDPVGQHDLGTLARRLTLTAVKQREVVGEPVAVLLDEAPRADLLVVGSRTLGPGRRMILGSTSRALARWSPVPVVVVPEAWMQPNMATAPVVAAVHPYAWPMTPADPEDREVLDFAFRRAAALRVPLVVVSAWEIPTIFAWSPPDIERIRSSYDAAMETRLVPWRDRFPQVEVLVRSVAERPAQAVLDASGVAQIVVLGRHHSAANTDSLGSTVRHTLQHSTRPVAVVPHGSREELARNLAMGRSMHQMPWTPTF
jgi:nucleotide-binding universal stress UspA family protein